MPKNLQSLIVQHEKTITQVLIHESNHRAQVLMDVFANCSNPTAFVAALIGHLLVEHDRHLCTPPSRRSTT